MSKWINKELFDNFKREKVDEKDTGGSYKISDLVWQTPERGTTEKPKIYEGRFLQHPNCKPYKKYFYHMWQSGDSWVFVLCPKTDDFKNYCPFCSAVSKLYAGTSQDKKQAYNMKRKEKFVGNFYVIKDFRDEDRDEEKKVIGKVKIYEFPSTVEKKLKSEITDSDQGYSHEIFDPSESGRNFILKVLSTKKDKNNKEWPDYSSSVFSRNQLALGTEEEIEEIMKTCTNIDEYIESKKTSMDKQVEILKNEFIWDIVKSECLKNGYEDVEVESSNEKTKEKSEEKTKKTSEVVEDMPWDKEEESSEGSESKEESKDVDDVDDDELLRELDSM